MILIVYQNNILHNSKISKLLLSKLLLAFKKLKYKTT